MTNVAVIDNSYLEATGIDRILKQAEFDVKTQHFLSSKEAEAGLSENKSDVFFVDTRTLKDDLEKFTRAVKQELPAAYVIWLTPDDDHLTEFDAICANADGCVSKLDFNAIVTAVEAASNGQVLFTKERLLDFARKASVLFSRSGRQLAELTTRERQVLELLRQGAKNKEIGVALFISVETVKIHVKNIREKLGVASRRQLLDGIPSRSNLAADQLT